MKEQVSFKGNLLLWGLVFGVWFVSLVFVSFTANVALEMPERHGGSITRFVRGVVSPAVLFWPWIVAAMIAYIVGPAALAIGVARIVIKKFRR